MKDRTTIAALLLPIVAIVAIVCTFIIFHFNV